MLKFPHTHELGVACASILQSPYDVDTLIVRLHNLHKVRYSRNTQMSGDTNIWAKEKDEKARTLNIASSFA